MKKYFSFIFIVYGICFRSLKHKIFQFHYIFVLQLNNTDCKVRLSKKGLDMLVYVVFLLTIYDFEIVKERTITLHMGRLRVRLSSRIHFTYIDKSPGPTHLDNKPEGSKGQTCINANL